MRRSRARGGVRTGDPARFRHIATTLLTNRSGKNILTVAPAAVLSIIRAPHRPYVSWRDAGVTSRMVISRTGSRDSRRVHEDRRFSVPLALARRWGAADGDDLVWLVEGGTWDIHVLPPGRDPASVKKRPASGTPKMTSRPLGSSGCIYSGKKSGTPRYMAVLPRHCLYILGLDGDSYARWGRSGSLDPCGKGDEGAKKITSKRYSRGGTSYKSSYTVGLDDALAARVAGMERPAVRWDVASDGSGRWEVRVRV